MHLCSLKRVGKNQKKKKKVTVTGHFHLQMMRLKKPEKRDTRVEPNLSHTEISMASTMNSPIFLCNQPSLVPCFWPSIHPDAMGSSQFLMPHGAMHQGQDNSMGSIIVLPVPWMLPFLSPASMFPTSDRQNEASTTYQCSNICSSDTLPREESNQFSLHQRTVPVGNVHVAKITLPLDTADQCTSISPPERLSHAFSQTTTSTVSATDHMAWSLSNKARELHLSPRKPEDVFSASEARRRRKELMRLKNSDCYHVHTR